MTLFRSTMNFFQLLLSLVRKPCEECFCTGLIEKPFNRPRRTYTCKACSGTGYQWRTFSLKGLRQKRGFEEHSTVQP